MKEISINSPTHGDFIIKIDDNDYDKVIKFKWYIRKCDKSFYAARCIKVNRKNTVIYLHRFLTDCPNGFIVDHADGDTMNCQQINLRICTNKENIRNQRRHDSNTSGFKGVHLNKDINRYFARIQVDRKIVFLGYHPSAKDAAKAYNNAAILHFGDYARLNIFP